MTQERVKHKSRESETPSEVENKVDTSDTDELLNEIDNAEEFVKQYTQKGGE